MSDLALPTAPLRDLMAWWRITKTKGLIIGGLAVALRSEARTTRDVDAVVFVDEPLWSSFLKKGREFSFRTRISDPLDFAEKSRMLLLHHAPSKIDVDISLANSEFELEALKRATLVKIGRVSVPVATPEDLIVFKTVAHRTIDMVDIEKLLDLCDNLDCAYIRKQVDELAQILEMPDMFMELDQRLREYEKTRRRRKK